jgi:hypothetical protein
MRFTAAGSCVLLLSAACSSSPKSSGQTGSVRPGPGEPGPGASADECRVASDCDESVRAELAAFAAPVAGGVDIERTECMHVSLSSGHRGSSCVCYVAGGGARTIGPVGVDCFVYGRGGDCLARGPEFEGCDVNDATSCDEVCAELQPALDADAARTFEASSFYQACEEQVCQTVIEVDGRCFPEGSYTAGRSYECSLGGEAILAAEREARQSPPHDTRPETRSPYVAETDGFVQLVVAQSHVGGSASPLSFGVGAQFAEIAPGEKASFGTILDPLDGVDDCSVFQGGGAGVGSGITFYDAAEVSLLDGGTRWPLELSVASNEFFTSYVLELDPERAPPRYGERYGVHVEGGRFGEVFDSADGLGLPEALEVWELSTAEHLPQSGLSLSWTGRGEEPLYLHMIVGREWGGVFESSELECLMRDDGAFTIPAAVLQVMPAGFASVTVERRERRIVQSGAHSLLLEGSISLSYAFAFGPACENEAALEGCLASVERINAAYADCGLEAPALDAQCPPFLATACHVCPEYFSCMADRARCTEEGFVTPSGCFCAD